MNKNYYKKISTLKKRDFSNLTNKNLETFLEKYEIIYFLWEVIKASIKWLVIDLIAILIIFLLLTSLQVTQEAVVKSVIISTFGLAIITLVTQFIQVTKDKKSRKQQMCEKIVPPLNIFFQLICERKFIMVTREKLVESLETVDREMLFYGTRSIIYQWKNVYHDFKSFIENNTIQPEQEKRMINFILQVRKQIGHEDLITSRKYVSDFLTRNLDT